MPKFKKPSRPPHAPKPRPVRMMLMVLIFFSISIIKDYKPRQKAVKINLEDSCYIGLVGQSEFPAEAEILADGFNRHLDFGMNNISKIVGIKGSYVWLKMNFTLPPELKDKDLGLFISYIHFADKVWVNGNFCGGYGHFPPEEMSAQYISHAYYFPKGIVNQEGENTILIQVWNHGSGSIAGKCFVSEYEEVKRTESFSSMSTHYVYMYFEGGMFASAILFLFLYVRRRKQKEYFFFSILCLSTIMFSGILFAPTNPYFVYSGIQYFKLYRSLLCFMGLVIMTLLVAFIRHYMELPANGRIGLLRTLIFFIQIIVLYSTKCYDDIVKITPFLMLTSFIHVVFIVTCIMTGFKQEGNRKRAIVFTACFAPFILFMVADFILRGVFKIITIPYYSYFGWQLTIISFLFLLSYNHSKILEKNEYLNANLQMEVNAQTENLRIANEMLEERIKRSQIDLKMASIVQQKIFPYPNKNFTGWDIAVAYEPLTEVSGDFYDYYSLGNTLDGISLFDVSGHGVAASLVTMLAKNIVYNAFQKNRFYDVPISKCLLDINHNLIAAKGSIENYMTGIMFRFSSFDENDACEVALANAGHPRPILYSVKNDECEELKGDSGEKQVGALGMNDIEVSFRDVRFKMQQNDVLVCYTDGITEAKNIHGELFGKKRLMNIIKENHNKDAHRMLQVIQSEYNAFVGEADREDDVTVFILKREDSRDFLEALDSE